jgi:HCOMODA/2-hydroxy-3-carboxy-muconic semialdehyde decarboxylase
VPDLSDVRYQVALANRMLANEGVLDAFGHVSLRHPADPDRYLLSRSRSPGLIEPDDILEFTLDSQPVAPPSVQLYAERVIHGCIYQARPDVMAVCHHHAPAVMPFCIAGLPIIAVFQLGAAAGRRCRSGTSATSSATPICWWSSPRRAARSHARSASSTRSS